MTVQPGGEPHLPGAHGQERSGTERHDQEVIVGLQLMHGGRGRVHRAV
ncbi:MAG: hypothetical protein MUF33_10405 [Candidatus Nanopelagicales bacterium]|nr:hypothetical protein [Candidatus Nanopelagicales bacterium]